jgi:hypothetical protein
MKIKTREQIALEYGICRKTLRKWLASTEYLFPRHLTLPWQKLIYEEFDFPLGVEKEPYGEVKFPRLYRENFSE